MMQFNVAKHIVLHLGHSNVYHQYVMNKVPITTSDSERDIGGVALGILYQVLEHTIFKKKYTWAYIKDTSDRTWEPLVIKARPRKICKEYLEI